MVTWGIKRGKVKGKQRMVQGNGRMHGCGSNNGFEMHSAIYQNLWRGRPFMIIRRTINYRKNRIEIHAFGRLCTMSGVTCRVSDGNVYGWYFEIDGFFFGRDDFRLNFVVVGVGKEVATGLCGH